MPLDLDNLLRKATSHVSDCSKVSVKWLIRDKSPEYFENLSDEVLEPILKDNGGHSDNPINSNLKGVFFMAADKINCNSVFGSKRYCININDIIKDGYNMYFSDFYCLARTGPHYIQIVVAPHNSDASRQCEDCDKNKNKNKKNKNTFIFKITMYNIRFTNIHNI